MVLEGKIYGLRMHIVADNKIPFLKGALENVADVSYVPGNKITKGDLLNADALLVRTRTRCNRELLEGTRVKFIATATIGHDHIDADFCREAGISWTNAPGCNSSSVRQYMLSTFLYLAIEKGLDLRKSTLGIVGVGNVGSKVATAAEALGMRVLLNDPPREREEGPGSFVSLEKIKQEADIISFHVPLNPRGEDRTLHMMDEAFLEGTKEQLVLINTSRGPVVSEKALLAGIRNGKIKEAILDVYEEEPKISTALLDALTLATPHIAGYSLDGKANGTTMSVRALSQFFKLGMDDWSPGGIAAPDQPILLGDAGSEDFYDLLRDLYRETYDVSEDDRKLRSAPGDFEKQRGDYPFRREPGAYSVKLFQTYKEIEDVLLALGFHVLTDYCM